MGKPDHRMGAASLGQREALARLKRAVLEDYSYRDLRGVNWTRRFSALGPRLLRARTAEAFAAEAAPLLSAAQDIHLWLRVGGHTVVTYRRHARRNVDLGLLPGIVPGWRQHNPVVASGWFPSTADLRSHKSGAGTASSPALAARPKNHGDEAVPAPFLNRPGLPPRIAYICLRSWPADEPKAIEPAYRVLRCAKAAGQRLIIDVRANGGGAEPLAGRFAGRFISRPVCYAKHFRRRAGQFIGPVERWLKPARAGWRFRGHIALLVGAGTVSSCESFVLMMRQVPGCRVIGQPTAGASGNPKPFDLGNGVVVFLPSWQDMDPDCNCLEGRGIEPDIRVGVETEPCSGEDPVLAAALRFLGAGPSKRRAIQVVGQASRLSAPPRAMCARTWQWGGQARRLPHYMRSQLTN